MDGYFIIGPETDRPCAQCSEAAGTSTVARRSKDINTGRKLFASDYYQIVPDIPLLVKVTTFPVFAALTKLVYPSHSVSNVQRRNGRDTEQHDAEQRSSVAM